MAYKCKEDVKPQKGRQTQLFKIVANQEADFILCGGSRFGGKSELLSMMDLLFAHDPMFRSIKFRRSYDEIMGANGLWEKAVNQYTWFGAKPNKTDKSWTFPSGAKAFYRHMHTDGDEETHRGKGYSAIYFDEINTFTWDMVKMLQTCLRSEADMNSFMLGTLNPNSQNWTMQFVDYYLDQKTGFPDQDKCGEIRWYIIKDEVPIFGPDEEFFKENYPESVYITMPDGETQYVRPKRFTFFFFNIFDNEIGLRSNPQYLSELNALPQHQRDTQLFGNWFSKEKGDQLFDSAWLKTADSIPDGSIACRAWDKAYSDNVKNHPDFTASVKMWKSPVGDYYITGDWDERLHDDFKAGEDIIYGKFRKLSGQRNEWMLRQALYDGDECLIVHPEESGAGKGECEQLTKMFTEAGYRCTTVKTGTASQAKKQKFINFTSAAQNGLIYILPDTFGNVATYKAYIKELEQFSGERSTSKRKDDWVDVTSDCFLTLCKETVHTPFILPTFKQGTALSRLKQTIYNRRGR